MTYDQLRYVIQVCTVESRTEISGVNDEINHYAYCTTTGSKDQPDNLIYSSYSKRQYMTYMEDGSIEYAYTEYSVLCAVCQFVYKSTVVTKDTRKV